MRPIIFWLTMLAWLICCTSPALSSQDNSLHSMNLQYVGSVEYSAAKYTLTETKLNKVTTLDVLSDHGRLVVIAVNGRFKFTLYNDGTIQHSEDFSVDKAASEFWRVLAKSEPRICNGEQP